MMSRRTGDNGGDRSLAGDVPCRRRRRVFVLSLVTLVVALLCFQDHAFFNGFCTIPGVARIARITTGRTTLRVGSDPVNNVSPEMNAAAKQYAQKYEDIVLKGRDVWAHMKKEKVPKKVFIIGAPGSSGGEIAESLCDALGYAPAPDGVKFIHRQPGMGYPPIIYTLWETTKLIGNKSSIAPTDLFIEDEAKYRDLETEVLKDFMALEPNGYPMVCVVGEGAVVRQENLDIIKQGIVIWLDVDPTFSWMKVMTRPNPGCGLFVPPEFQERPPPWAIANGWDGDPDDTEGREEFVKIIESRRKAYDEIADFRLRVDVPGVADNSYWGAERILKAMAEILGLSDEEGTVEQEVMEKDLAKFLEGARLSKYLDTAVTWCNEQGAASIEEVVENVPEFAEALKLKPLEKKRLEKAAAAVVA